MRSRIIALWCAGVVLATALTLPRELSAHARLKSSLPAADSHLGIAPREIRLDFSEIPAFAFSRVILRDSRGQAVPLGPLAYAADSRRSIVVRILGEIIEGQYAVEWQVASDDGHPVRGAFSFFVVPGAAGLGRHDSAMSVHDSAMVMAEHHDPVSMPTNEEFGVESPLFVVVRWLQFIALVVVVGTIAFTQVVLRLFARRIDAATDLVGAARIRAAGCGFVAGITLMLSALLRLAAQSVAMHGAAQAKNADLVGSMVSGTAWGHAWSLQVAATLIFIVAMLFLRRSSEPRVFGWVIATLAMVLMAFTPGLSGHAATAPRMAPLAMLADALHIIGAGGWLGSLLLVVGVGIPVALSLAEARRGAAVADLFNAFSPTALVFAAFVGMTGLFAGWLHLGSIPALWESTYGKTLLLKLVLLSLVSVTGAYNWLRVKPTLGQIEGAARVRRSASVELIVGVLVLLVTAILVALPTAMDMQM